MRNIVAKELGKHDAHYEKGKQGRKDAPQHSEISALIFLFEIALDELAEKEAMLFKFAHDTVFVRFF